MNLNKRWLIAVFICATHLAVALWLASYYTTWFERHTIGMMGKQVAEECQSLFEKCSEAINADPSMKDGGINTCEIGKLSKLLGNAWNKIYPLDNRFVCIVDLNSELMYECTPSSKSQTTKPVPFSIKENSIVDFYSEASLSLEGWLNDTFVRSANGQMKIDNRDYIVHVNRMHSSERVIIVGQGSREIYAEFRAWFEVARQVCFSGVIILGFLTIFLITSVMQKVEIQFSKFHSQLQSMVEKRTHELNNTKNGVIFGLAKLAESRDNDTGDHLDRIGAYVVILAEELKGKIADIDDRFIQNLSLASSLHDIGKVGIPDAVLLKPGRLSDLERKIMQFHTTIGYECLEAIEARIGSDDFLRMACDIARYHHERWDGKGYPEGVSGNNIPIAARIVAVADVYDALTSRRPYKQPFSHEKSCEIICAESGTQFDPQVVEAFRAQRDDFKFVMERTNKNLDDTAIIPAIAKLQLALSMTSIPDAGATMLMTARTV